MNIKKYFLNTIFILTFAFGIFSNANSIFAASDLIGSAWSGNIGWITFNCLSTSSCGTNNSTAYKVTINDQNRLEGYAWSDNIGWIYFDPNLSTCPGASSGACIPRIIYSGLPADKYTFYGFAKAVSGNGSISGSGFSGFIDLNGLNTGAAVGGTRKMLANSYAWGSDLIGWIDMSDVSVAPPNWSPALTINLTANKQTLSRVNAEASRVLITYNVSPLPGGTNIGNYVTCDREKFVDGVLSPNTTWNSWNATGTVAVNDSRYYDLKDQPYNTTYKITCRNSQTNQTATASLLIPFMPEVTLSSNVSSVPHYYIGNNPFKNPINLSWTARNASSCTSKKVVAGFDVADPVWTGTIWSGTNSSVTPASGTKAVTYDGSSDVTYTITCVGPRPDLIASKSVTITIIKPTVELTALPAGTQYTSGPNKNMNPTTVTALSPYNASSLSFEHTANMTWKLNNFQTTYYNQVVCRSKKYVNGQTASTYYDFNNTWGGRILPTPPLPFGTIRSISVTGGPSIADYEITCTNGSTRESATAVVTIPVTGSAAILSTPSITSFTASPATFSTPTGNTTLSWTAINATSCNLSKISPVYSSISSGSLPNDSEQDMVTANSTYQLFCTDGVNTVSKTLTVSVNVPNTPAPTVTLYATVSPVATTARNTTLYWNSSASATSCRLTRASDGAQLYPASPATYGSVTNNNASTGIVTSVAGTEDTYVVDCKDNYSQSGYSSKNIKVTPPVPAVVGFGVGVVGTLSTNAVTGSVKTLLWSVSGTSSCTASSNPGSPWQSGNISGTGSTNVTVRSTPGNQQYTLSCVDNYGSPVTPVTVNIAVQIPGPSIDRFEAFPPTITSVSDNKIRIEWESSNTNSCALSRTSPDNVSYGNNLPVDGTQNNIAISTNGLAGVATDVYHLDCVQNSTLRHDVRDLSVQVDTLTKKIKVIER